MNRIFVQKMGCTSDITAKVESTSVCCLSGLHFPVSVHRNIGVESCLNMAFEVSSPPNQEVRDAQKPREDRANLPRGA